MWVIVIDKSSYTTLERCTSKQLMGVDDGGMSNIVDNAYKPSIRFTEKTIKKSQQQSQFQVYISHEMP